MTEENAAAAVSAPRAGRSEWPARIVLDHPGPVMSISIRGRAVT